LKVFRNYSINQATNKSKISVMENKRLSTIASKLINVVKYFSMDVARVLIGNVLRYFRLKGRRLAPFSENFQKEQNKIWIRNHTVFLSVPYAALLILSWPTSLQKLFGNFFVRKKLFCFLFAFIWWMEVII